MVDVILFMVEAGVAVSALEIILPPNLVAALHVHCQIPLPAKGFAADVAGV